MPSMDDWSELGTYLEFLVTVKQPHGNERFLIEVRNEQDSDTPKYDIVWDVPYDLFKCLSDFMNHKLVTMNPILKDKTIQKMIDVVASALSKEEKRLTDKSYGK